MCVSLSPSLVTTGNRLKLAISSFEKQSLHQLSEGKSNRVEFISEFMFEFRFEIISEIIFEIIFEFECPW